MLERCQNVNMLNLSECKGLESDFNLEADHLKLEKLFLNQTLIHSSSLKSIVEKCSALKTLKLRNCRSIDDETFSHQVPSLICY